MSSDNVRQKVRFDAEMQLLQSEQWDGHWEWRLWLSPETHQTKQFLVAEIICGKLRETIRISIGAEHGKLSVQMVGYEMPKASAAE